MQYLARKIHKYPVDLFNLFCRLVGAYVGYYALALVPFAAFLYSDQGSLPIYSLNNLPVWTSFFNFFDSPIIIIGGLCALAFFGGALLFGSRNIFIPIAAWLLYVSFQNRNVLTENPATDITGFLLLVIALVFFSQKVFSKEKIADFIQIPYVLYEGIWVVIGLAFTASGIARIRGESWLFGTGIGDMFTVMPIRANIVSATLQTWITSLPASILSSLTFTVSMIFILALPLSLFKQTRPYLLLCLIAMYMVVFVITDMSQILFAVFLLFLLVSDVLYPSAKTLPKTVSRALTHTVRHRFLRS